GADAPWCVPARPAWIAGAGENIAPAELPRLHAAPVNALQPLPTAAVVRNFDEMGLGGDFQPIVAPAWRTAEEAAAGAAALGNDLAAPACALMPEIGDMLAALSAEPGVLHAGLSGSGATCFAITADAAAA